MSRDYRLRVSNPYFLYSYVQKYKSVASVGPRWPWARVPCTLYCYATVFLTDLNPLNGGDVNWLHLATQV